MKKPDTGMSKGMSASMSKEMAAAMPPFRSLYVILHGLVCVRLNRSARTVQLHFPSVPMHVYHYGTYGNLLPLAYGHDYALGGVRAGAWYPNQSSIEQVHVTVNLSGYGGLQCAPRSTHATVTLPWPDSLGGVRRITNPEASPLPDFLFNYSEVNPRSLYYVTYLKYSVGPGDHPDLTKCCKIIWHAEPVAAVTRLHFFADPPEKLNNKVFDAHIPDAYDRLNDQIFMGGFPLTPNIEPNSRWTFADCEIPDIIPNVEAQDYALSLEVKTEVKTMGDGGNCLQVVVTDAA